MKALYSNDTSKIEDAVKNLFRDDQGYKTTLAQVWLRNINFANGNQFFNYNAAPAFYGNNPILQGSQNIGMGQLLATNEIEPILRTMVSFLTRAKGAIEVFPADKTDQGRYRAKLAEQIHNIKYEIDNEVMKSQMAAHWAMVCGTVIRKDFWDYTVTKDAEWIVHDEFGNEVTDPQTGQVMTKRSRIGSNAVSINTPFTISTDPEETERDNLPWILETYIKPIEWAREAYNKQEEGYTGKAHLIGEDSATGDVIGMFEQLKYATPIYSIFGGGRGPMKDKTLVHEIYVRPNDEFPNGRLLIVAGCQLVYAYDSPYFFGAEPIQWHPYKFYSYEPYIGRFWGKSLVEQLVPIQVRINEINTAIIHNANTLAKPNICAAEKQLKRGILNGEGANVYTYNMVPNAPPPFVMQGTPLPAQFFEEKQQLIDAMVRIVGTNFVMQGKPPSGVTAAAAIEQLLENANTQQSMVVQGWEEFHGLAYTSKLRLLRDFLKNPDPAIDDYLRTMAPDALQFQLKSFKGEDLSEGIGVRIVQGSMVPKSETAKRSMYNDMVKNGIIIGLNEDSPRGEKVREQYLEKMGLEGFETEQSVQAKRAQWENENMMQGIPAHVSKYDVTPVHMGTHLTTYLSPEFQERATPEQRQLFETHMQEHEMAEQQKQEQSQMQAMAAQGMLPPGAPPPEGPPAMPDQGQMVA